MSLEVLVHPPVIPPVELNAPEDVQDDLSVRRTDSSAVSIQVSATHSTAAHMAQVVNVPGVPSFRSLTDQDEVVFG